MHFAFTQIYVEPGAAFDFLADPLRLLAAELDTLGLAFPQLQKRYGTENFELVFILTATTKSQTLTVKGPCYLRKNPTVEFALWIPFRAIEDGFERCMYVACYVREAVVEVCARFKQPAPDMTTFLDKFSAKLHVAATPLTFRGEERFQGDFSE